MNTPRVAILAGLFVAGGLVGAGATALLTMDDAEPADLVAGEQPSWELGPNGGVAITIDVYNPNERNVGVEPLAIAGWEPIDGPSDPVDAAPKTWTAVTLEVVPDCEGLPGGTLDLVTDDVVSELELTDYVIDTVDGERRRYCGGDIVLDPVIEARSWDGDTYVLDVRIPGHGRAGLGGLSIVEATAGVPFLVETEGLPATLPVDDSITLTTRWTFDCDPDLDVLADQVVSGGDMPYEAMFMTTADAVQIHADVSSLLSMARARACVDAQ